HELAVQKPSCGCAQVLVERSEGPVDHAQGGVVVTLSQERQQLARIRVGAHAGRVGAAFAGQELLEVLDCRGGDAAGAVHQALHGEFLAHELLLDDHP
ncbi:hypothetical protein RZS08_44190, partial [Arthrospira platensis SPKY1]|nr:hypothetical protein [Arthrospira platensis SPKY1]